ncbi:MAG: sensor histidine kinase [Nitrospirota bacterium]
METKISFRHKLALLHSIILFFLLVVMNIILFFSLKNLMYNQVEATLSIYAEDIEHEFHEEKHDDAISKISSENHGYTVFDEELRDINKYIQILDRDKKVIFQSKELTAKVFPVDNQAFSNALKGRIIYTTIYNFEGNNVREIFFPLKKDNRIEFILQLGLSLHDINETLSNFFYLLVLLSICILIFSAFGGIILAKETLKPIDEITKTVQNITDKNLKERLKPIGGNDELGLLIDVLNEMLDRLEKSFEAQKRFTADASHEIRSPLTIMKGNIEVILRKKRSQEEYIQIMESNLEEINRLSRITNALLMLARVDSGEIGIAKEPMNLYDVIHDLYSDFLDTARENGIDMTLTGEKDSEMIGDKDKIRQLFVNLLENAVRYTKEGGRIDISISKDNSSLQTIVKDTGIGIYKKELNKVFDRFYRSDAARSRESGGAGLGLSICQWIASAHKGSITVESEIGKGSKFIITLHNSPPSP